MSDETPRRYKTEDEYSMDEQVRAVQARRAGKPVPRFERPEYRKHKAGALREAGLDDEADELEATAAGPVPMEERTTEEHLHRIQAADGSGR